MRSATLKILLNNYDKPFEITVTNFLFEYGVGKEKWGNEDLVLQYAFKVFTMEQMNLFKTYMRNIAPYLDTMKNIKEIQIEIVDNEDPNDKLFMTFKQGEFENFNMIYVIDHNPRIMVAFNVNPPKESLE